MRKAISIILAIAMLVTLMPTFALAADETTPAGITLSYNVTKKFGGWGNTTVRFDSFTYEESNGLWEYAANTNNLPSADKSATINWSGTDGMQMRAGWWAIKINVPKSGVYTPKINYRKYREAALLNLYLIKADGELDEKEMNEENLLGGIDCYGSEFASVTTQTPAELTPRYIEAGEYYFVYKNVKKTSPSGTGWVFFGNIALDGNGTDTVLASVFADEQEKIPSGQKLGVKLYMSDGTPATGTYNISYSSDNPQVTVATDGTVRAASGASANVTVSVTNESGYTISDVKKVNVVNGATIKYDLVKHYNKDLGYYNTKGGSLYNIDETLTKGFFSFVGGTDWDHNDVKYYQNLQLMYDGTHVAFKINVPVAGYYDFLMDVLAKPETARCDVDMDVYISKTAISEDTKDYVASYNVAKIGGEEGQILNGVKLFSYTFDEPGSYIINFDLDGSGNKFSYVGSFYLVGGEKTALMNGKISSTAASINVDEKETATVSATGFLSKDASAATFTYSSNDTSVATVDATSGVVTPVKAGKATITATANADVANTLTTDITVTENLPGEEVEDTKVNFTAFAENGGTVTDDKVVREVPIGSKITVEATANEGYEFAYWRNASGKHLSSDAKETFTVNTNTAVIAVFDKTATTEADTTAPVYFYNENGSLIEKKDVEKGKTFGEAKEKVETSLTGHVFSKWSIDDNVVINNLLRAVALYNKEEKVYKVTVGGQKVAEGKYGEDVTVTGGDNFKAWKLGNNIVSYEKEYKFLIWGDIALTEVTEGEAKAEPTIAINKSGENYFIAYNVPNGYTLVEAGIVFANSGTPTIGSFYSKATAKETTGQFTSKSGDGTETTARGYLIFRDASGSVRVIYAD